MNGRSYYNEIDPYCAGWLENLMRAGEIPEGDVDRRSIEDVDPADLAGYVQCHFFAGIAGWPLALRLAGWPADRPVWTGSCPCQPLSGAGQRKGHADERHLWPAFYRIIAERGPATVFGEQVASNLGREWLAGVRADLELLGYAVGAADLPAACAGAPHVRQRLGWVGNTGGARLQGREFGEACDRDGNRSQAHGPARQPSRSCWAGADQVECTDGKVRRVEPGIFPLADGVSGRVGRLRAYGNAIVPQVKAAFIEAAAGVTA